MTDQKNLDLLQSQRKKQEEKRQQAHAAVETLQARLAVLCQEARCQSPEELPAAEAASAEVLRLRQEREACHAQLLELAAGATIEALMAEAAAISPDSMPGELQQIADAIADLERTRGELRETIGGEKTVLAGMDTSAAAAEAAEDAQDILARLEPDVQHYLRLRLASAVLREGIERYRKKNEGPVLGRASDLFRRLTLGSFEALRIDFDDRGEQVLAGVRPDGKAVLPTAMSEGTCDQLYLALRLASLETWLAAERADAVDRRRHPGEFRQPAGRGDAGSPGRVIRADAGDFLRPSRASLGPGHAMHAGRGAVRASAVKFVRLQAKPAIPS